MYQPPPGRPISSPPCDLISVAAQPNKRHRRWQKMPLALRDAVRSDYLAGMPTAEIAQKHDLGSSAVTRAVSDIANRHKSNKGDVAPPAPSLKPVRLDGEDRHVYANRVQQWMRENDPEWHARWKAKNSAALRRYWKKRRAKAEREAAKAEPLPPMPQTVPTPPVMPTLWQRIVSLFR